MERKVLKIGERLIRDEELYPLLERYQMIPQLAREIILEEAIATVECSLEEQQQAKLRFCQQNQISSNEQLQAWLTQSGMTEAQLDVGILRELKLEKFKQSKWEGQLESYFLESKNRLDRV
ncbi:MAG: peptidylprolyl isomerase, partial [Microcystaceae cyanobacterium]